jgi:hypothetical protein
MQQLRQQFAGGQPPVQRHQDRAQALAGQQASQHRGLVGAKPGHDVARPDARRAKLAGLVDDEGFEVHPGQTSGIGFKQHRLRRGPQLLAPP